MKSIFVFSLLFFSSLTVSAQTYRELSEKAIDCIERDSLAQAEDLLVQAMKLEPSNPHNALLFSNLGLVQRRLGRYDDALQSYTYALNIAPNAVPILLDRAAIYMEKGMTDRAFLDYSEALEADKGNKEALLMRALSILSGVIIKRRVSTMTGCWNWILRVMPAVSGWLLSNRKKANSGKLLNW